jgi:hypothetical protein
MGMVKKSEGKEKAIQFSPGGNCSNWVTLPLSRLRMWRSLKSFLAKTIFILSYD